MTVKTVWRATTPEQNKKDRAENATVTVSAKQPDSDDPVLYEIHVPEDKLQPTDVEGVFEFVWSDVDNFPHQVKYR